MQTEGQQRLDKWLWAARFFKTRKLAAEAVSGGKVHLNGDRVKPSRNIKVGDELKITRGQFEHQLSVEGLNKQRRPADEARLLYIESQQSIEKRQSLAESLKILNANRPHTEKRPDKKQRREIVRFKQDY
ncbi:MAG TPA: RNA-binding protein [Gammaproteobacteria bacterium]|nr:RNA-binding protein [Gammaproteobacteria bacterium]